MKYALAIFAALALMPSQVSADHHETPVYKGKIVYPDFNGRDREHRMFRTRIREGMSKGVAFAGKYAVIQFGCGTHCMVTYLGDVSTGRVIRFPRGGEAEYVAVMEMRPWSNIAELRWDDGQICYRETAVMRNGAIELRDLKEIGPETVC